MPRTKGDESGLAESDCAETQWADSDCAEAQRADSAGAEAKVTGPELLQLGCNSDPYP
jgi:hypothetical protein